MSQNNQKKFKPRSRAKWMREIKRYREKSYEYAIVISYLEKYAKWIDDHKVTKAVEFRKVIEHLQAWKKTCDAMVKIDTYKLEKSSKKSKGEQVEFT